MVDDTIREHIVTEESLARACKLIRIDESADLGGVISALEIVEAGLYGEELAKSVKIWCF